MMKRRHSLLWKLAFCQVAFCLLLVWLIFVWGLQVERSTYFLNEEDRAFLTEYARTAEQVVQSETREGVEAWRQALEQHEHTWVALIGPRLETLGTRPLSAEEAGHLTFMRKLDWPMTRRLQAELPFVSIEFPEHPERGRLVMQLPERLLPAGQTLGTHLLSHGVVPALLALGLGLLLYRQLIIPLADLRERANALRADDLESITTSHVARRKDELGELAQAFDHMAQRLTQSLSQQRQLLRTLSHEIRTPLTRLRVASESQLEPAQFEERVCREVDEMQRLVNDALNLAWLDAERPSLPTEPVIVLSVWEALAADASFETDWPLAQLVCDLGPDCVVAVHLDSLAQALENLMRNAIRHSPPGGKVRLSGVRFGSTWHLRVEDEGRGVPEADLERIFEPFLRLDNVQSKGFGLGLSIARRAIELQGGRLWATPGKPGLVLNVNLPAANV